MKSRLVLPNRLVLIGDLILLVVAALGSFALRTDLGPLFVSYLPQVRVLIVVSLLVYPPVFYAVGLISPAVVLCKHQGAAADRPGSHRWGFAGEFGNCALTIDQVHTELSQECSTFGLAAGARIGRRIPVCDAFAARAPGELLPAGLAREG